MTDAAKEANCKGCGARILWIKTTTGGSMPCDPKMLTLVTEDGATIRGRVPHWATCPNAKDFKR